MLSQQDISKIQALPIEQVADALGLKVKKHWSLCPFHSDSNPSLYFRTSKNRYQCFVCNHHGGPIDLTMEVMRLNFRDAVCWLAQAFGIIIDDKNQRSFHDIHPREVKPVQQEVFYPFDPSLFAQMVAEPILTDEARHFLFDIRRLDPRVIQWCGISSTHTDLLIPYFDTDGKLISIQWRNLGFRNSFCESDEAMTEVPRLTSSSTSWFRSSEVPRFRFPKGAQCHIYNLQILKALKKDEPLFIAEGCSDCWALLSSGHKAIAIPSATLLTPQDLKILSTLSSNLSTQFHMYPDNDAPGERLYQQLSSLIAHHSSFIKHPLPPDCKDFSDYYLKQISEC